MSNSFRDILLPKMLEKYTDSGKVNLSHLLDGKVEKDIEIKREGIGVLIRKSIVGCSSHL